MFFLQIKTLDHQLIGVWKNLNDRAFFTTVFASQHGYSIAFFDVESHNDLNNFRRQWTDFLIALFDQLARDRPKNSASPGFLGIFL